MIEIFPIQNLSDEELLAQLREKRIGLTVDEARKVFSILGRDPTIVEITIWGIQGSEHSSYKSSRKFLRLLPTEGGSVVLGPSEDSGVVRFTDEWGIVVSHESHNAPSQVVPYEGAATGVGGICRDVLCMGAKVIALLDPLRFGEVDRHETKVIANGVVAGIGGYGNPIGVPNIGGDVYFDKTYNDACLVNVVALGLVRNEEIIHSFVPDEAADEKYEFIVIGKPTDQSGFGGASFASVQIDPNDKEANRGAVQEPNPFLERHLMSSTVDLFKKLRARGDLDKVGFKDMGAGGILCATVEMVDQQGFGADIMLENIHTALEGLKPEVIACSETQERFCWAVHPSLSEFVLDHYNNVWDLPKVSAGAQASKIGVVTHGGQYKITFHGETICDAPAKDITEGLQYDRAYTNPGQSFEEPVVESVDVQDMFVKLLASENIASRECIYETYDKTVQGQSWFEPGEADAGVIRPLLNEVFEQEDSPDIWRGLAVKADGNGRYGLISPYWQGVNAVVESMRNVVATGGVPQCLTDCLNYGNPEIPEQMWEFVEGVKGIADAANGIHRKGTLEATPIISGNVSLYKTSYRGAIAPTSIVACVGMIEDVRNAVGQKLVSPDSVLVLIGDRRDELGGGECYRILGHLGANLPKPNFDEVTKQISVMTDVIASGLVRSCHDISDGGIAITLAEMAMKNHKNTSMDIGLEVDLSKIGGSMPSWKKFFSESGGWVAEIDPVHLNQLQEIFQKEQVELFVLGKTTSVDPAMSGIVIKDQEEIIQATNTEIYDIWGTVLREKLG